MKYEFCCVTGVQNVVFFVGGSFSSYPFAFQCASTVRKCYAFSSRRHDPRNEQGMGDNLHTEPCRSGILCPFGNLLSARSTFRAWTATVVETTALWTRGCWVIYLEASKYVQKTSAAGRCMFNYHRTLICETQSVFKQEWVRPGCSFAILRPERTTSKGSLAKE